MEKTKFNSFIPSKGDRPHHEPVRSAKEVMSLCGFNAISTLHSAVARGAFPAPTFQSKGVTGVRRNFWKLSDIKEFIK